MLYISDTDDGNNANNRPTVAWSQYYAAPPINFSDSPESSQGSSSLMLMMRGGDSPLSNSSSLNMGPLLSSRTVLSPIDDVDESLLSRLEPPSPLVHFVNRKSQQDFAGLMNFAFKSSEAVFGRKAPATSQRSRVGPMDVDYDDTDGSWLNAPAKEQNKVDDEHTRKRRLMSQANDGDNKMVLGNTPFTFSMPPRQTEPEPMLVDSEAAVTRPAVRSSDNNPISPNAVRKIYSRRRNQQQIARRRNMPIGFGEASSSWTTDDEANEDNKDNEEDSDRVSVHSNASSRAPMSQRRLQRQRQRQQSRLHRRSSAVTRGVDRMLALMGSRVDEPTVVERLQMYRDIPYVISGYLQLVFNVFMVGTVLLIIVHVLLTIQRDVNSKVQEYSAEVLQEIAACSKQYRDNRCEPALRVPHMEAACNYWDTCMHRDPTKIGRAKVSAETLAEIINGFIEPISLKTMLFFVLIFFGTLFISNFAFGAYRHSRVRQQYVTQSGDRQQQSHSLPQQRVRREDDYLASPTPRPPQSSESTASGLPLLRAPSPRTRSRSASSSTANRHHRLAPSADLHRRKPGANR
ncbi:hypothetical protein GGH94_004978 [Coemansia aciculifera]|uniref:Brl1/Brr6 domain-containing protein n=1 Tax=Coemansia aciculifera TaxID=417176 RepID=A0A9W8M4R1_9FUNG|nr:hypothetical protein GGH94_004978 [Coemansia aciculifera]KAJ2871342.1 hypothetical protein GGH93_004888 [Coemansia aciculifera]